MKSARFLLILLELMIAPASLPAQTAVFTYQGRLLDGGQPANGSYDLRFRLADATNNGNYVGPALTRTAVAVSNGLFAAALDFGASIFDGSARWLEIGVRTNGSIDPYVLLSPRQAITATPYSTFANTAASAAVAANLTPGAAITVNGAGITNLNGAELQAGTVNSNAFDAATRALLALAGTGGGTPGTTNITIQQGSNTISVYLLAERDRTNWWVDANAPNPNIAGKYPWTSVVYDGINGIWITNYVKDATFRIESVLR